MKFEDFMVGDISLDGWKRIPNQDIEYEVKE